MASPLFFRMINKPFNEKVDDMSMFKILGCIVAIILGIILIKYGLVMLAAGIGSILIALGCKKANGG